MEEIAQVNKTKSLFFEKIKKNWQTISQTYQEKKGEYPTKYN